MKTISNAEQREVYETGKKFHIISDEGKWQWQSGLPSNKGDKKKKRLEKCMRDCFTIHMGHVAYSGNARLFLIILNIFKITLKLNI